jgi:hypothetical protein
MELEQRLAEDVVYLASSSSMIEPVVAEQTEIRDSAGVPSSVGLLASSAMIPASLTEDQGTRSARRATGTEVAGRTRSAPAAMSLLAYRVERAFGESLHVQTESRHGG